MKITVGKLKHVVREALLKRSDLRRLGRKSGKCVKCGTYHMTDTCPADDNDPDDLPPAQSDALDVPPEYDFPVKMRMAA